MNEKNQVKKFKKKNKWKKTIEKSEEEVELTQFEFSCVFICRR